jgi:hypothetical protein
MNSGGEMAIVDPSGIGVEMYEAKGLEQLLQFHNHFLCPTTELLRQALPRQRVKRMPQPALVRFPLHETPHFLDLRGFDSTDLYGTRVAIASCHHTSMDWGARTHLFFNSSLTLMGLICRTRAISRTPLPVRGMSTICRFTADKRPGDA